MKKTQKESKTIPVTELHPMYFQFGNKGAVWGNKTHIAKAGLNSNTLCDTPMLSSNWAEIEKHKEIGCPECIEAYKKESMITT